MNRVLYTEEYRLGYKIKTVQRVSISIPHRVRPVTRILRHIHSNKVTHAHTQ